MAKPLVAVVGRPNVGKSSLTNALLGQDRVIVSDVAGTTRDSIDTYWTHGDQKFVLIDTAGMRRKSKIDEAVERYRIVRSLRSVDRSDIVVLVLDAQDGVTEQDKKIAGYAYEAGEQDSQKAIDLLLPHSHARFAFAQRAGLPLSAVPQGRRGILRSVPFAGRTEGSQQSRH